MAAVEFYSTVKRVKNETGIKVGDLSYITTEAELDAEITEWLKDVKGYIDEYAKRDFAQEEEAARDATTGVSSSPVPRAIHSIADRCAVNIYQRKRLNRNSGVVTQDEYEERSSGPQSGHVLTNDIRADLKLFRRSHREERSSGSFRMAVVPGRRRTL